MQEPGRSQRKLNIPYLEGVNSLVGYNLGKKTEFFHAENARSKTIGTIEKREGQTVTGTNTSGAPFVTSDNYGLFPFQNNRTGLYRVSANQNSTLSINLSDTIVVSESKTIAHPSGTFPGPTFNSDQISILEDVKVSITPAGTIYYLDKVNAQWTPLTGAGTSIAGGSFSHAYAEGSMFLVNQAGANRYVSSDGITVTSSSTATGHLLNTPNSSLVNFYKNRLYLGDFISSGVRYKTTILRSSYPVGIIALVNADVTTVNDSGSNVLSVNVNDVILIGDSRTISHPSGTFPSVTDMNNEQMVIFEQVSVVIGSTIPVTDTTYFYTTDGAANYNVYRGGNLIQTITVTAIQEVSITAKVTQALKTSDEIWVEGTFTGPKVFRWVNNSSITGKDVKQYDTFKLSGGENDELTMMTNIGNVMLLSNKSSMASWNDYILENFDLEIGCVSKRGHVKYLGTLYFLHYTGVYATTGGVPQLISAKVKRYIDGATKAGKEACAAGRKGYSVFFTIGDVTLYRDDGSTEKVLKDVALEYNILQKNWYVHTNIKASQFATYVESADTERLMLTDTGGIKSVKEFLSGTTDDGKEVSFRVDTNKLSFQSDYEYLANPIAVVLESDRGTGMEVYMKFDHSEEFYALEGEALKGLSILKVTPRDIDRGLPPVARMATISVRDSTKKLCRLSRMSVIFLPSSTEDSTNEDESYG